MKQYVPPRRCTGGEVRCSLFRMFRDTNMGKRWKFAQFSLGTLVTGWLRMGRPDTEIRSGRRDQSVKCSTESRWLLPATPDVTCAA